MSILLFRLLVKLLLLNYIRLSTLPTCIYLQYTKLTKSLCYNALAQIVCEVILQSHDGYFAYLAHVAYYTCISYYLYDAYDAVWGAKTQISDNRVSVSENFSSDTEYKRNKLYNYVVQKGEVSGQI